MTEAVTKGAEWADREGSTQFSDIVDPARSHSQAAQASAANLGTTGANRKLGPLPIEINLLVDFSKYL